MRRDAAAYQRMSWPDENYQFGRFTERPPPKRRSPAPLAGGNRAMSSASTGDTPFNAILTAAQARAAAEVLFEPRAAA
jgi:hypothetical protein